MEKKRKDNRKRRKTVSDDESDEESQREIFNYQIELSSQFKFSKYSFSSGFVSKIFEGLIGDVKIVKKQFKFTTNIDAVNNEITILKHLENGPNIIKLIAIIKDPIDTYPSLIFEHLPTLFKDVYLSFNAFEAKMYLKELLKALTFCHSRNIIHGDIKPSNIVIDKAKNSLRLIDFGSSVLYQQCKKYDIRGTLKYLSPEELLDQKDIQFATDMWSFGCILAEVTYRKAPFFKGFTKSSQLSKITDVLGTKNFRIYLATHRIDYMIYEEKHPKSSTNLQTDYSQNISPDAVDLIDKILQYDPDVRLSACDAMQQRYFLQGFNRGSPIFEISWIDSS